MKSYLLDKMTSSPATRRTVNKLVNENSLFRLQGAIPTAITDNSTGVGTVGWKAVPLGKKFAHVGAATDLADRTDFYVVAQKVNAAITTLKGNINLYLTLLAITTATGGNGAAGTANTIAAMEKTVDGTAAATALAIARSEGNAVIDNLRDNMSTLLLATNRIADLFGYKRVMDQGDSKANSSLILANMPTAGTAITNAGDALSKAAADAAFGILTDNVAVLAKKINDMRTAIDVRIN